MKCETCGQRLVKNGLNPSGSQKYLCKGCRRVSTPHPTPVGASAETKQRALNLVLDGSSFRSAARQVGVSHVIVMAWFKTAADQVPETPAKPTQPPEQVELDELFTFVGDKKTKSSSSRRSSAKRAVS
jgi:transposase-like protein